MVTACSFPAIFATTQEQSADLSAAAYLPGNPGLCHYAGQPFVPFYHQPPFLRDPADEKSTAGAPPVPMDSPVYHDEVGDLIDTYNYMTRKMNELIQKQAKASEDLRIAEFNSLQAQIEPTFSV